MAVNKGLCQVRGAVARSGSCLTQLSGILVSEKELFMSGMKDQRANMAVINLHTLRHSRNWKKKFKKYFLLVESERRTYVLLSVQGKRQELGSQMRL